MKQLNSWILQFLAFRKVSVVKFAAQVKWSTGLRGNGNNFAFFPAGLGSQGSSHHQNYSIFSRESQPKPSFVTGILGGR